MKKTLLSLCFFVLSISLLTAQNRGFNYKALIADNGNALINQNVNIKFTILESNTTVVYQETHTATTDANGIVSVSVGEGTVVSGDFTTIDWTNHPYFLKVEIDSGSGYQNFGTSELKSVPYAKYADKAGNTFSGDFNDLSNVPTGLADGDDVNDADHDPANELQTLSVSGNQLSITNGNTVTLNGDNWGSQVISRDASLNGDGTPAHPLGVNVNAGIFSNWDKNAADDFSGDFNDLTNIPTGLSDGDDDTHLTDADIAAMGYIKNPDDADSDDTNELQNLSLSGNQLSISNGNNVTFTGWDTNANDDVQALNDLTDAKTTTYGVYVGPDSGTNANSIGDLVALGRYVMPNASSADYSVGIGNFALNSLTSGSYNTAIGYSAGYGVHTGSNNTFIGYYAGYQTTGSDNVFIGYNAGRNETGSNKLYIANSPTATPLIYGDFNTNELTVNGSLSIKDGTQGVGKILVSNSNGKAHWSDVLPKQNKVMDISQFDAVSVYQTDNLFQTMNGVTVTDTNSTTYLYFPIRLPEGVILQSIVVYFRDNSSNDLYIQIAKQKNYASGGTSLDSFTTSGSVNGILNHTFSISETTSSSYSYYVFVMPKSGDQWDTHMSIRGIRVFYAE